MKTTFSVAVSYTLVLLALIAIPLGDWQTSPIAAFLGNFHPLVLHLPIGALLALFTLEVVNLLAPKLALDNAAKVLLWFSAASLLPAVLFGFFLAAGGGYREELLTFHQWLGWSTALLCIWLLVLRQWAHQRGGTFVRIYQFTLLVNVATLSAAGHFGGSLTHGPNYLTKDMPVALKKLVGMPVAASKPATTSTVAQQVSAPTEEAVQFLEHIYPVLEQRCFECHNANKQKGDLRLDTITGFWATAKAQDLWDDILYEVTERNMPPEEKAPLSDQDYQLLTSWIDESLKAAAPPKNTQAQVKLASLNTSPPPAPREEPKAPPYYLQNIQPIFEQYCYGCHGPDRQKGGVRLDVLDADFINGADAQRWHAALDEINAGNMPPKKKPQLSAEELELVSSWITASLKEAAKAHKGKQQVKARRLTKVQYTNTLNELLKLPINFGDVLPDDAKSKSGFTNNAEALQVSQLHIEYYQKIAREALDKAIVSGPKPQPIRYKITFGEGIGQGLPAAEFKGYQTAAISGDHFRIDILDANGQEIIGTTEEERDSLRQVKELIGVGMRGSSSDRYGITDQGLILYSAIPHKEQPPRSWQGPSPNMKVLIKNNYPQSGSFVFRVEASKGTTLPLKEGIYALREEAPAAPTADQIELPATAFGQLKNLELRADGKLIPKETDAEASAKGVLKVSKAGIYQIDMVHPYVSQENMPSFRLRIGKFRRLQERLRFEPVHATSDSLITPITLAYLKPGTYDLNIGGKFFVGFKSLLVTPLADDHPISRSLFEEAATNTEKYAGETPAIRVYAGSRTDDGMDYSNFGEVVAVTSPLGEYQTFEFSGQLENLPIPDFDINDNNPLSNTMNVGLWNNYFVTSKTETGPPLLIRSVELEAPYHPQWPPESHTTIFFESPNQDNPEIYTAEVLLAFMEKGFRRPVSMDELNRYLEFWKEIKDDYTSYEQSVKEVLVAVLCSPSFLYILEDTPAKAYGNEDQYVLASKLSYFLWNAPPDQELLDLARLGLLKDQLPAQIQRMTQDPRVMRMVEAFAYDWLRIDRLKTMNTSVKYYPDFTHFVKEDMEKETYYFLHRLLQENLSVLNIIDSDFAMLNQNLAEFYGIDGVVGSHFRPVAIPPAANRGGLLSQGAFLTGHSDGVQAHPIKRAVWLKEKILGDPPPPPPPNVPELDPETPGFEHLTLKEQLELHRNKPSCVSCHLKIDPYGVVFENYDAVGRYQQTAKDKPIDAVSILPDGTKIEGVQGIKDYIRNYKRDQFAHAFVEHLYTYALGREVGFADDEALEAIVAQLKGGDYKIHSAIEAIVLSESFTHQVN
ncbi:DUF1592 domain-containing protein [Marinoscillum furvescens]|uniref:Putative membrane protein n=1 Tax=Marinoscillum furvescens DSM 4134 TaxID=1122208 RepID=A0A3D9L492_MARFU|nr:DUF1592 domain-containing protein [Marinoscillum furvescens]RED98391.1 putative membrane protein [Marinoscillum furvescens DSM 4134]